MAPSAKRVLIAGGGIGGLTAAIALKRAGFEVHVFERADEIRNIGAGIILQVNATAALNHIGLVDAIREAGIVLTEAQILAPDGSLFSSVPLQQLSEQIGFPGVAIHRGRLQSILLQALGEEHVTTGAEVDHIEEAGDLIRVRRPDGSWAEADVLIGADGVHSYVRRHLWGDQPRRYSGYTAWRGICANPHLSPQSVIVEVWGDKQVFGYLPIDDSLMYWFATKWVAADEADQGDPRDEILQRFAHLPAPIPQLIESTEPEQLLRNDIYDRPPISPWGRGRITLLGDAAHPMTPNMGQGGGQAVEDAIVLAHVLAEGDDMAASLRAYESRRHPRANHFVTQSRMFTAVAHGHPLWARLARATVFRWMPEAVKSRQMQKLYRFEI